MLQAQTYWRDARARDRPRDSGTRKRGDTGGRFTKRSTSSIQSHGAAPAGERSGGIYLRDEELIPPEDLTLLRTVARVVVVGARGTLPQQFGLPAELPDLPELITMRRDPRDPSAVLPFIDLAYFNSLGGFTPDGHEYAIYLGPGMNTPAPWVNVIANPGFGTMVSETGAGFTWQGNSERNRLTEWSNDPVMDPATEAIYIRDEDTGIFWTPARRPYAKTRRTGPGTGRDTRCSSTTATASNRN